MPLRSASLARVVAVAAAALTLALLWAAAGPPPASAEEQGPTQIVINRLPGAKAVPFDHAAHSKQTPCLQCHHTGKNVACGSAECHQLKATGPSQPDLKVALHKRCIPCHAKQKAATKCAGPGTCHGPAS